MLRQLCSFVSTAFSFIAWGIVSARYGPPALRFQQRVKALWSVSSFSPMSAANSKGGSVITFRSDIPGFRRHPTFAGPCLARVIPCVIPLLTTTRYESRA